MASPSRFKRVCETCGYDGEVELLLSCVQCNDSFVHRYCLDDLNPHDDNIEWKCEDCAPKVSKVNSIRKSERTTLKKDHDVEVGVNYIDKLSKNGSLFGRCTTMNGGILSKTPPVSDCFVLDTQEKRNQFMNDGTFEYQEPTKESREVGIEDEDTLGGNCIDDNVPYSSSNILLNKVNCLPLLRHDSKFTSSSPIVEKKNQPLNGDGFVNQERSTKRRRLMMEDEATYEDESNLLPPLEHNDRFISSTPSDEKNNLPFNPHPCHDHIWSGHFASSGRKSMTNVGLLGHLSSNTCSKVCEAAKMLPAIVNIDFFPRKEVWLERFQHTPPAEDIAIYFFPEFQRDERSFDSILNDIVERDLALKAWMDDVELLVFSSRVLPQQLWRFRRKYYLWGLFKSRKFLNSPKTTTSPITKSSNVECDYSGLNDLLATDTKKICLLKDVHIATPKVQSSYNMDTSNHVPVTLPPFVHTCIHGSNKTEQSCDKVRCSEVHEERCEEGRPNSDAISMKLEMQSNSFMENENHIHFTAHLGLKDRIGARSSRGGLSKIFWGKKDSRSRRFKLNTVAKTQWNVLFWAKSGKSCE